MKPGVALRLALAGNRSDSVRISLTAFGAALGTLALLAAATVLSVTIDPLRTSDLPRYTNNLLNDPGVRPGVAIALILLTIPIVAFVAQCARLGAPGRDRRLAAVRLAGATPRQVRWITAVETGVASVLGVAVGFGAYFAGRRLLDSPDPRGLRALPTDVLPAWPMLVGVGAGVPLFVTLFALFALRRVAVTPLGVVRPQKPKRPSMFPAVLIALGVAGFGMVYPLYEWVLRTKVESPDRNSWSYATVGLLVLAMLLLSVGVVSGTGWLTYVSGRVFHRVARGPVGLLAGQRMMADPWSGSRTFSAMLVAVVFGAGTAACYAWIVAEFSARDLAYRRSAELSGQPYYPEDYSFYLRAFELVGYALTVAVVVAVLGLLVALTDGIAARRRTLAALVAAGTPRGVLARATAWQMLLPVVPALLLAASIGVVASAWFLPDVTAIGGGATVCSPAPGDSMDSCNDAGYFAAHSKELVETTVTMPVPVPWEQLGMLVGGAFAAAVSITVIGLLFLRASTNMNELRTT